MSVRADLLNMCYGISGSHLHLGMMNTIIVPRLKTVLTVAEMAEWELEAVQLFCFDIKMEKRLKTSKATSFLIENQKFHYTCSVNQARSSLEKSWCESGFKVCKTSNNRLNPQNSKDFVYFPHFHGVHGVQGVHRTTPLQLNEMQ